MTGRTVVQFDDGIDRLPGQGSAGTIPTGLPDGQKMSENQGEGL